MSVKTGDVTAFQSMNQRDDIVLLLIIPIQFPVFVKDIFKKLEN